MRFFEYEAREIVRRAGIPVTDYGFTRDPAEAGGIAARIGGPVVVKSQVLSGGRMKAGGIRFADSPAEAEREARAVLDLEIGGHRPRGVLVDPRASVVREFYAGVVWDGIRKRPVMLFSDMGGIDIEEVAETHPDHVGRGHFSTVLPLSDFRAKEVIASVGVTGSRLNRLVPILTRLAGLFLERDMTLAEINPLGSSGTARSWRSTRIWRWRTRPAAATRTCSTRSASVTRRRGWRASRRRLSWRGRRSTGRTTAGWRGT